MSATGSVPRPPHGRPLGLLVLVLALHLGLGLALHHLLRPGPHGPAAAAPVHVWITRFSPAPAPPLPQPVRPDDIRRQTTARPATAPQNSARPVEPQAISLPASPMAATATPTPALAEPAAVAAPASPPAPAAPLNLALPSRPASAPPAAAWTRNDPRVHDAPQDGEQRMARTLGTDTTLRTARRGDGVELHRGSGCAQVQPTRAGQILPTDTSAARPALVGKC